MGIPQAHDHRQGCVQAYVHIEKESLRILRKSARVDCELTVNCMAAV